MRGGNRTKRASRASARVEAASVAPARALPLSAVSEALEAATRWDSAHPGGLGRAPRASRAGPVAAGQPAAGGHTLARLTRLAPPVVRDMAGGRKPRSARDRVRARRSASTARSRNQASASRTARGHIRVPEHSARTQRARHDDPDDESAPPAGRPRVRWDPAVIERRAERVQAAMAAPAQRPGAGEAPDRAKGKSRAREARPAVDVLAWARRLGVIPEASVPSNASAVFAARARQRAIGALDQRKLKQALAWAEDFVAETDGRAFFVSLDGPADGAGSAYNWESLDGFAEYVRAAGSRVQKKEGKKLSGDYIQSLAGALRILREEAIGASVVLPRPSTSRTFKAMRKEDGPPGSRDSRRALRAHHLRALVEKGWHLEHPDAWEVALVAHNLLLRGGEVGRVEGRDASGRPIEFDERRGLTWGSVEWRQPSVASGWRAWAVGWVCAIKDQSNTNKRQPIVIAQRVAKGSLDDPMWFASRDGGMLGIVASEGVPLRLLSRRLDTLLR